MGIGQCFKCPFSLKRYYPIYGSCGKPINSTKMMKLDRVGLNETTDNYQTGLNAPLMNINTSNLQRACNRAATLCGTSNFSCIRDRSGDKNCQFFGNIPGYFLEFWTFWIPLEESKACNGNQNSMEAAELGLTEFVAIQQFSTTLLLIYSLHVIQPWPVTWATISLKVLHTVMSNVSPTVLMMLSDIKFLFIYWFDFHRIRLNFNKIKNVSVRGGASIVEVLTLIWRAPF